MNTPPYHDIRSEFFREYFERALSYPDYLLTGKRHERERWESYAAGISLTAEQLRQAQAFKRKIPVLVLSGIWCGDCARQGPMLRALELASPLLIFRFIDNKANASLQEELRVNGAEKVPVVVSFSEDFFEVGRFGDRHLSVYRRKLNAELGAACDPGIETREAELSVELGEWVTYFERLQALLRLSPLLRKRYAD